MARIAILLPLAIVLGFALAPITVPVAAQPSDASVPFAGRVVDQDGDPVAEAIVDIYQWRYDQRCDGEAKPTDDSSGGASSTDPAAPAYCGEDGSQHFVTGADGRFSTTLRTGDVSLNIYKDGYAGVYEYFDASPSSGERTFELLRFPEKTAHIEGRVVDATNGASLRWVSISVESPLYGLYECSIRDGDPTYDDPPRPMPVEADGGSGASGSEPASIAVGEPYPGYPSGCAITIHDDGSFEGDVTPGYSILRVYYDAWSSCTDGGRLSYPASCSPDYFPLTVTRDLPADASTRLRFELTPRPGPDAVLQGYVVDSTTQQAIPGVQVSFSNQDSWGWANGETDSDGSYKVRLRSGYTQISVWADGYLPWEGSLFIPSGKDTSFDIHLTPGDSRYGGCCYAYARGTALEDSAEGGAPAAMPGLSGASTTTGTQQAEAGAFQDLGGGLGPYDADARSEGGEVQDTPTIALLLVGTLLAMTALVLRRRR